MNGLSKTYRLILSSGIVLWRRAPYIFFSFLCLSGSGYLATEAYYRYAPAGWFISITEPPRIENGSVNRDLNLTFCRMTRYPNIKATTTRSFYKVSGSNYQPAGDYEFAATIESGKKCQVIAIKPARHPNVAGRFTSHTETTFYVNGYRKVFSYDTNQFTISDTADSLQKRIDDLQRQIDNLKLQTGDTSTTVTKSLSAPALASSQTVLPGAVVSRQTDTTRPTTPPTSSPPNPPVEPSSEPVPLAVIPRVGLDDALLQVTTGLQGVVISSVRAVTGLLR